MNLLFVCSRNQWRSPTAEKIFNGQKHSAKSAGTEKSARIKINSKLITWADMIFVMEKRHKQRLIEQYSDLLTDKPVIILDIPDEYPYMDEELVISLKAAAEPYLDESH